MCSNSHGMTCKRLHILSLTTRRRKKRTSGLHQENAATFLIRHNRRDTFYDVGRFVVGIFRMKCRASRTCTVFQRIENTHQWAPPTAKQSETFLVRRAGQLGQLSNMTHILANWACVARWTTHEKILVQDHNVKRNQPRHSHRATRERADDTPTSGDSEIVS